LGPIGEFFSVTRLVFLGIAPHAFFNEDFGEAFSLWFSSCLDGQIMTIGIWLRAGAAGRILLSSQVIAKDKLD
jgi:hypothetical protein